MAFDAVSTRMINAASKPSLQFVLKSVPRRT